MNKTAGFILGEHLAQEPLSGLGFSSIFAEVKYPTIFFVFSPSLRSPLASGSAFKRIQYLKKKIDWIP